MSTTIMDLEPSLNIKMALLQQEVNSAVSARWQLEMRLRVNKRIGSDKSVIDQIIAELERLEKYLAALDDESKTLANGDKP